MAAGAGAGAAGAAEVASAGLFCVVVATQHAAVTE